MTPISPVDFLIGRWEDCFPTQGWQLEKGEGLQLEEFLSQTAVTLPAAFFSYGGFIARDEAINDAGRCTAYQRSCIIYFMLDGDKYPTADLFCRYMNTRPNNEFVDLDGEGKVLTLVNGDGTRLPMEGIPAFEMTFIIT